MRAARGGYRLIPWRAPIEIKLSDAKCVPCTFDQVDGIVVDGLTLVPVSADDCPGCERGYPECPE